MNTTATVTSLNMLRRAFTNDSNHWEEKELLFKKIECITELNEELRMKKGEVAQAEMSYIPAEELYNEAWLRSKFVVHSRSLVASFN